VNPVDWAALEHRPQAALWLLELGDWAELAGALHPEHDRLAPNTIAAVHIAAKRSSRNDEEESWHWFRLLDELLVRGGVAGQTDPFGRSALHLAVLDGNERVAERLLQAGAWPLEQQVEEVTQLAIRHRVACILEKAGIQASAAIASANACEAAYPSSSLPTTPPALAPSAAAAAAAATSPVGVRGSLGSSPASAPAATVVATTTTTTTTIQPTPPTSSPSGSSRRPPLRQRPTATAGEAAAGVSRGMPAQSEAASDRVPLAGGDVVRSIAPSHSQLPSSPYNAEPDGPTEKLATSKDWPFGQQAPLASALREAATLQELEEEKEALRKAAALAVSKGDRMSLQALVLRGLVLHPQEVELRHSLKGNLLDLAVVKGHQEMALALLSMAKEQGSLEDFVASARFALLWAVQQDFQALVEELLRWHALMEEEDEVAGSPLRIAVETSNLELATLLLRAGAWARERQKDRVLQSMHDRHLLTHLDPGTGSGIGAVKAKELEIVAKEAFGVADLSCVPAC